MWFPFFVVSYCQRFRTLSRSNRPWYIHIWAGRSDNCLSKTLHYIFKKDVPSYWLWLPLHIISFHAPSMTGFTTLQKHVQLHALEEGPWIEKLICCPYFFWLCFLTCCYIIRVWVLEPFNARLISVASNPLNQLLCCEQTWSST